MSLLEIENLSLTIGSTPILKGVELTIAPGEVVGLVGESGSGKSMTALTVMRLLPHLARAGGRVTFDGIDILGATEDQMCALRGDDIGMVFQEPMAALNPVKTIGEQVAEGIRWHTRAGRAEAEERARKILDRVGLPEARFPLSRYPHELSGGQRQRVVIAIACALKPKLLVADEPTTALDVVLQAQILDLLRDLVSENRMGLLLISHDLAVVTEMADRLTILRNGEVMEAGDTARTLSEQLHPYTRELAFASMHVPARPKAHLAGSAKPLLEVENVGRDYPSRRTSLFRPAQPIRAVDDVSLTIEPAQSVALVGRSGCGKSTLARMILALDKPTAGTIRFRGEPITGRPESALRPARRDMQVVFQDPYGSFDPRQKVEKLVAEPLHLLERQPAKAERREMVAHALHEVGLGPRDMDKYPHEFSGGQRQRLSIARAIITRP
ncbi:MAG: ABC transporter ATP-binding protein, partial [Alphaproteobacteria bacterium]|nr:ABC transporter ATP-binding protein [Alphaproteobacteria bacterium]